MNIDSLKTQLQGKKTYIAAGMGVLYIAGVFLELWAWDERVLAVFGLSGLAFLRAAVPKANEEGKMQNAEKGTGNAGTAVFLLLTSAFLMALYVDGAEEDSMTASGPIALNNLPLTLGDNAANRGRRWNGWLDDARLYDRGLSIEEIKTLHQIRQAADQVRKHAEEWIDAATIAREQYAIFKSEYSRNALLDALTALKRSASAATSIQEIYGPSNDD